MPTIVDYASLTQSISDYCHRADLATLGFTDDFISAAQEALESDVFDLNFGNGIMGMEKGYGPYPIVNGVAPVPTDWIAPKLMYIADGAGSNQALTFKDAEWIYSIYPLRQGGGIPAYIARDVWQSSFAMPLTFTASAGQTVFALGASPGNASIVLVSLDGAVLFPGSDFTLSGSTLTLTTGALIGQTLSVQFLTTSSGTQAFTASAGQIAFPLSNPSAAVILASLDGAVLNAGTDYLVAGGFLRLSTAATAGQTLTVYYASGSVFIFGPYADGDYSVQGTYYARATLLSSSSPTNWMVQSAPNCLHSACMVEAAKFLKDDAMLSRWGSVYQQRLKALVDRDKAETWSAGTLAIELG